MHLVGFIIRILLVCPTLRKEAHIFSHNLGKDHLNAVKLTTTSRYPNLFPSLLCRQKILGVFLGSPICLSRTTKLTMLFYSYSPCFNAYVEFSKHLFNFVI